MGMPATVRYWTPDDVRALPDDGKRYECIDGELLVSPSPRVAHQRALLRLLVTVAEYLRDNPVGEVLPSPADIEMVPGQLVQPDFFVVPGAPRPNSKWTDIKGLLLAVEVLSPSTAKHDRGIKRRFYTHSPTDEYWVVDADARVIERWRRGDERPEILADQVVWHPAGATAPLQVDLTTFFASVHAE
jgi:Uma2 family endonuclease